MPDIKEKSTQVKIKGRSNKTRLPYEMGQQMKEKAVRELRRQDPSHPEPQEQQSAGVYATDRLEDGARQTGHYVGSAAKDGVQRYRQKKALEIKQRRQEEYRRQDTGPTASNTETGTEPDMPETAAEPSQTHYMDAAQRRHYGSTAPEYEPPSYSGDIPEPQRQLWKEKAIKAKQEKMRRDAYHAPEPVQERGELVPAIKERSADSVVKDYYDGPKVSAYEHNPTATTTETYTPTTPTGEAHRPNILTGRERRAADTAVEQRPSGAAAKERGHGSTAIKERRIDKSTIKERKPTGAAIKERKTNTAIAPKTKDAHTAPQAKPGILQRRSAARQFTKRAERQARQRVKKQAAKQAAKATAKTAKATGKAVVRIGKVVGAALAKGISAIIAAGGGGILLVVLLFIGVIAAIAASPFGLFFASEQNGPGTVSVAEAVAQVNIDFNNQLEALQAGEYDEIIIEGAAPSWAEVLAVFASKTAGADDGVDVATMDAERVELLKAVFWDMCALSSAVETIDHPDSDPNDDVDDSYTEHILTITISAKTAEEMRTVYAFTDFQNDALTELLADTFSLSSLAGDLTITNVDARALLDALPEDLPEERRAVVKTACTLVGKVNYFWGGKSLTLGWDSRWGQVQKVWADGSSSTGTYRPFGLDCSGFVDWVFYNVSNGDYIIGHGGGAYRQHTYCTDIEWSEARPGDLAFYPGDEHVGIVGGRDESGNLLIIHCASGANNVVITGADGFIAVARPYYYD